MTTRLTKDTLDAAYITLVERARPDLAYVVLGIAAAVLCAFGFKMNSAAVIVGAMVVSPLLYPVVCLGAASMRRDRAGVVRALGTLGLGLGIAVLVSTFLHLFFLTSFQSEVVTRLATSGSDYFLVALFAGLAGTFAFFWPDTLEAVAGISIAVALLPPVVLVGVGLGDLDMALALRSVIIVVANIAGIFAGSALMYSFLRHEAGV